MVGTGEELVALKLGNPAQTLSTAAEGEAEKGSQAPGFPVAHQALLEPVATLKAQVQATFPAEVAAETAAPAELAGSQFTATGGIPNGY